MSSKTRAAAIGFLLAGISAPLVVRAAADPTTRELLDELKALQSKVDRLEAQQAKQAPTLVKTPPATPATPVDQGAANTAILSGPTAPSAADAVQADAYRHSQPLQSALMGGWDGNALSLRTSDGNFSFHPGVVLDFRNMTSYRERIPAKGGGETGETGYDVQNGFDVTRLRVLFDGSLYRDFNYFVQLQADQGNSFGLLDAFGTYHAPNTPFTFKFGQFKDPLFHERNLSEDNLLAVDRSLVESFLGGGQSGRVQGGGIIYDQDRLRGQFIIHDGLNSQNTKFYDLGGNGAGVGGGAGVTPTSFGSSARVELLAIGDRSGPSDAFTQYNQFTSLHDRQQMLVIGAGVDYSEAHGNNVLLHTVDAQYNSPDGIALYAAYLGSYRHLASNQGVAPGIYYDPGFIGQVAYLIGGANGHLEPFGRYDWTHLDPASTAGVTGLTSHIVQEITVGANYYIYGRKLKLTVDGTWLPDGSPADVDGLGVLRDSGHNEFLLRGQFQLAV